jgi:hypothetical protein
LELDAARAAIERVMASATDPDVRLPGLTDEEWQFIQQEVAHLLASPLEATVDDSWKYAE